MMMNFLQDYYGAIEIISFEDILECGKAKTLTEFDRLNPCNIIQVSTILSCPFSETFYQFFQRRNAFIYMIICPVFDANFLLVSSENIFLLVLIYFICVSQTSIPSTNEIFLYYTDEKTVNKSALQTFRYTSIIIMHEKNCN